MPSPARVRDRSPARFGVDRIQPAYPGYPGYPTLGYQVQTAYVVASPGDGRLMAAGIMSIVCGVVSLFVAIFVYQGLKTVNDTCDAYGGCGTVGSSVNGWGWTMILVIVLVGGGFIAAGIGAVRRAQWGQISIIIVGALAVLLYLAALIGYGEPAVLIPIIWFGVITGLAISEDRSVFDRVKATRRGGQF